MVRSIDRGRFRVGAGAMTTPLIVCLFNRPQQAAALIESLRGQRPQRIWVIADGPRAYHREDRARCQESLDSQSRIDWPCWLSA